MLLATSRYEYSALAVTSRISDDTHPPRRPDPVKQQHVLSSCAESSPLESFKEASGDIWMHIDESVQLRYPSYTSDFASQVLDKWDFSSKSVFECGGGFSTIWWASKAKHVTTVDDEERFLCSIEASLLRHQTPARKFSLVVANGTSPCKSYLQSTDSTFDVIIVDGEPEHTRCDALRESIHHLNNGGVIIADNWAQPQVWEPCECCEEIETLYDVHVYKHSGWSQKGEPEKPEHPNWRTVWFGLTDRLQKEFTKDQKVVRRNPTRLPLDPLSNGAAIQVSVPFAGDALVVPGIATADWWAGVTSGFWEPSTWRVFNQEIHMKGVYIGFGEWCGVTGMFAARRSSKTILMEPDPFIFNEMVQNVRLNVPAYNGKVYADRRCISDVKKTLKMKADGSSGSRLITDGDSQTQANIDVDCVLLEHIVEEYQVEYSDSVFIKIDTEGAEAFIVPSLGPLMAKFDTQPTLLISMHASGSDTERKRFAEFLNTYKYYAILPGRNTETREFSSEGVDDGKCAEGIVVTRNQGARFNADLLCDWCDYLLVADNTASKRLCDATT